MPDIETYSPRKVTDQNRDLLPSTHDPKKRKTYVQITLEEPEIQEAIRNYIRAQYPTLPDEELPVKIVAGRGENGHSATIIKEPIPVTVESPTQPQTAVASFTAAQEDANRRNKGEETEDGPEVQEAAEAPETSGEPEEGPEPGHVQPDGDVVDVKDTTPDEPAAEPEPESAPAEASEDTPEAPAAEVTPEKPAEPPKKSSLFDTPKPVEDNSSAAEAAATPPEADPVEAAEASAPPKPKSIFDN